MGLNLAHALHGEQKFELHRLIPITGTLYTSCKTEAIYDKGDAGAVVHTTYEKRDEADNLICVNRPIMHGLCTFAFAGRAILHSKCGSGPVQVPFRSNGKTRLPGRYADY